MFIPGTGSEFFHTGSRVKKIPDLDPQQRIFNPNNYFQALGNINKKQIHIKENSNPNKNPRDKMKS
jgi:hypothetical protein